MERKEIKYDELRDDIALYNPHLRVLQLTFTIGYLGSTHDPSIRAALRSLCITD